MAAISDAVVIGIVLGLVFAAVSQYLQSRIAQQDRKISLMENILLDLKVVTEQSILSATEPNDSGPAPAEEVGSFPSARVAEQTPVDDASPTTRELTVDASPRARSPAAPVQVERASAAVVGPNQEAMTYRELVALAKHNGITGLRGASKAQVIDTLRSYPGTLAPVPTDSQQEQADITSFTSIAEADAKPLDSFLPATQDNSGLAPIESEPEASLVQ